MQRRTWLWLAAGSVVLALALAWAFMPTPIPVETATAARGVFETWVEDDGRTRVRDRYVLASPVAGRVQRIAFKEGDSLHEGDVAALIEPAEPVLLDPRALREQQARVASLSAALDRALAQAQSALLSRDKALIDLHRTQDLAERGFLSPSRVDADRLTVDSASRALEAAQESVEVARRDLQQAEVALDLDAQRARQASLMPKPAARPYLLRAPISGRVLRVLQASAAPVAQGAPLLEMADTQRLEVLVQMLTSEAARIEPGSAALLTRWGGAQTLRGRVRLIEPGGYTKVSALGVEEQRTNVLIDADIKDAPVLGDGWSVVVRVVTRRVDEALQVPVSAVFPMPSTATATTPAVTTTAPAPQPSAGNAAQQAVPMAAFVMSQGRARLRQLKVGGRNNDSAWITEGLQSGEAVIVYPPATLKDGQRVVLRQRG